MGYPLKAGQSACIDVAVGWANGSIVNPTLMPSSVGCEKHATQPTPLLVPSYVRSLNVWRIAIANPPYDLRTYVGLDFASYSFDTVNKH